MARTREYEVILEPEETGGYSVFVPELKGCVTQGDTREEAREMAKEAIELILEEVNEKNWTPQRSEARPSARAERTTVVVDLP